MNYPTRKDFFNAFGILTINEIKDGLIDRTENSRNKYNEIVKDFIKHLNLDDVRPDVDTETQDRFLNYGDKELIPFTDREIKLFEFDYGDDKKPLFDFIILEDNGATIQQTKVFCKWQNDTEEFVKLAFRTFKFREACKIVISQLLEQSKQPEAVKTKKEFKDFFNANISIEVIQKIQNDFKDCKGKKMAYLVYLLETDFKIITYSLKGENDSRKHFVEALINKTIAMQGINKYFESYDVKLKIYKFEKASDYVSIKEKLLKTII